MTNQELAKHLDNTGVKNLSKAELEHTALRFVELFRHGTSDRARIIDLQRQVTHVPYVVS